MEDIFEIQDKRPTAVDVVIDRIKQLLIDQKLRPGDMIPSESALAGSLKVSRGSVREAMKILSAFGIVEIKRGAGTYISNSANKRLFDPLLFQIIVQDRGYGSLVEMREMIEAGIVKLIINHATDEEIGRLKALQQEFTNAAELDMQDGGDRGNDYDIAYHRMMGGICHNPIVENIYSFIIELFAPTINAKLPGVIDIHASLTEAIAKRDLPTATALVSGHTSVWSSAS